MRERASWREVVCVSLTVYVESKLKSMKRHLVVDSSITTRAAHYSQLAVCCLSCYDVNTRSFYTSANNNSGFFFFCLFVCF